MTATKERPHSVENWVTFAVATAPTDWVNVYYTDTEYWVYTIPALLLQECTTETDYWVEPGPDGKDRYLHRTRKVDREVRTVFGNIDEFGHIDPADRSSNYLTSIPRREYEDAFHGKTPGPDGYPVKGEK